MRNQSEVNNHETKQVNHLGKRRRKSRTPDGRHRDARLTVRLAPEVLELVNAAAQTAGTSRSDLVQRVLEAGLAGGEQG